MTSLRLDELFTRPTGKASCETDSYSDLLDRVVESCPDANVVLESQQWSRLAAIQLGNCTIYEPSELASDELPFDPSEVAVQVAYYYDRKAEEWDLAWVATWPYEEE